MLDQDLQRAEQDVPDGFPARKPASEAERIRDSLRQAEIREGLLVLVEKMSRTAEVQQAAERNDLELLLAVRDAPQIIRQKIIGDATFKEVKNRWLELNSPDQFKRVRTVRMALSLFEHNVQTAEKIIAKASGVPFTRDLPLQDEIEAKMARRAS